MSLPEASSSDLTSFPQQIRHVRPLLLPCSSSSTAADAADG